MGMICKPQKTSRSQAITDVIESVALEQAALGRILSAESDKLERVISSCCVCPHILLATNRSVDRVINSVSRLEMVLQSKLELFEDCLCSYDYHGQIANQDH